MEYEVVMRGIHWWVVAEGFKDGPYVDKKTAVDAAIKLARDATAEGNTANVKVHHEPE